MNKLLAFVAVFLALPAHAAVITVDFESAVGNPTPDLCLFGCVSDGLIFTGGEAEASLTDYAGNTVLSLEDDDFIAQVNMGIAPGSGITEFQVLSFDIRLLNADTDIGDYPGLPINTWTTVNVASPVWSTSFGLTGSSLAMTPHFEIDNIVVDVVPIPAAAWLFGSGLMALWFKRRR